MNLSLIPVFLRRLMNLMLTCRKGSFTSFGKTWPSVRLSWKLMITRTSLHQVNSYVWLSNSTCWWWRSSWRCSFSSCLKMKKLSFSSLKCQNSINYKLNNLSNLFRPLLILIIRKRTLQITRNKLTFLRESWNFKQWLPWKSRKSRTLGW